MKKAKNSPTTVQVDEFAQYIEHFQSLLNLRDWRIEHSGRAAGRGAMADVGTSLEDRLAVWSIGNDWGPVPVTSKTLKETALHETLHIFLAPLIAACRTRDEEAILTAEHSVVAVLEKLLSKV